MRPLLTLLLLLAVLHPAAAAECPPEAPPGVPCLDPAESAMLEHVDRTDRLRRLSAGDVEFTFVEDQISAADLGLADFPQGLPILRVIADQDVFFDSGSDVIRPEAFRLIDIIAADLRREVSDVALFVAGHTDSDGEEGYNRELGLRRATRVAASLARSGIYQAAIYRVSFGELMPVAGNGTAAGKARNRRVEFLFAARPRAVAAYLARQPVAACGEALSGKAGDCRVSISIPVARIEIPPESADTVIGLDNVAQQVAADTSLTAVETAKLRQRIEHERERIPIEVHEDRVPIELTLQ